MWTKCQSWFLHPNLKLARVWSSTTILTPHAKTKQKYEFLFFFLFTLEEIKEIHARNFFEKFVKTMRVEDFGGKIIRQNISHQNQGSFPFPISYQ